jgi:hypothetical protein
MQTTHIRALRQKFLQKLVWLFQAKPAIMPEISGLRQALYYGKRK